MEVLKVKNWKELTRNRKEWNALIEKAKTHPGLWCCKRKRRRLDRRLHRPQILSGRNDEEKKPFRSRESNTDPPSHCFVTVRIMLYQLLLR